jgi:multidrug transporter EmrE-like cation transporter
VARHRSVAAIAITALLLGEEKITPIVLIGVVLLVAGIGSITAR